MLATTALSSLLLNAFSLTAAAVSAKENPPPRLEEVIPASGERVAGGGEVDDFPGPGDFAGGVY